MWNWDQGRLAYFQFDELRKIAKFALKHDLKNVDIAEISGATGLRFLPNDPDYPPWRNYARTFKLSMLATSAGKVSTPTAIASLLADDGKITTDEYFHFLAQATADPSPALQSWNHTAEPRYPLLFALKFLLTRAAIGEQDTEIDQIVAAYSETKFTGDENQTAFIGIVDKKRSKLRDVRQANESLRVLSQISYLNSDRTSISVSLDQEDALDIFNQLEPVSGNRLESGDDEIQRIAALFASAIADVDLEYSHTVVSNTEEAGFTEGGKIEQTHLKIERNGQLRRAFFDANPTSVCDFCENDTKEIYPWSDRVLDIHHVLPLSSGTRTSRSGTVLSDLVANCPTCHRAVHRYYTIWLKQNGKKDFQDAKEARNVYVQAKEAHKVRHA